jgi:beta-glucanase (GH16 family)
MYLKYDGSVSAETAAPNGLQLWANAAGQTLTGGALNDVLGGAGYDTLVGGDGDNQYYLSGLGNVIVQGATGTNTVTTWMSYSLPDNVQNLVVTGDGLYAAGNRLDNLIKVGDTNNMTLYGAGGNNVLVGGAGADTFVVDATSGSNAIYGWHSGDKIRLLASNLTTFADLQGAMTQRGSDVVLQSGQNHVVIRGATVAQFSAADFDLTLDLSKLGALSFTDDFNSLSLRSASNPTGTWTTDYGYGGIGSYTLTGNGELQLYTAPGFKGTTDHDLGLNPFSVSNGVLDIRAQTVDAATSAGMWNYGYSSGVITTKQSFSQTYGYFEMRADLPENVSGAWPAFWLVPADGSWPPELDVMETLSGTPNIDYTTVHSGVNGAHTAVGSANLVTDVTGYHTYGVLWTATTLTWYLDGQEVFQAATPADMNKPMYMIANMAVGGWAGAPNFTSADMLIDYIHAYALADGSSSSTSTVVGGSGTGGTTTTTTGGSGSTTAVSTADAVYLAPDGVTSITLTGSAQTVTGNALGDTFVSNNTANHLTGGAGVDTFFLGRGGDIATGGEGADKFVFNELPWAAGHITDFSGADTIDVSVLFSRAGYTGYDPVADGRLKFVANGQGGTQVWVDLSGLPSGSGSWLVTTLDSILPANVAYKNGLIVDPPSDPVVTPPIVTDPVVTPPVVTDPVVTPPTPPVVTPPITVVTPPTVTVVTPTSDAVYLAPAGVTTITLTGVRQTVTGNGAGDTFISNNSGNHLIGGAGADLFILGRGGDVASGGAGADKFVFNETPWAGGHITDFTPGVDAIDLTGLLARSGYAGANPIGDGYLKIVADAQGNAQVWSNLDHTSPGAGWWLVTTLDGVSTSSVGMHGALLGLATPTSPPGQTFTSDNAGDHWTGTAGADTFILGRGGDVVTGGAGADSFVFNEVPWAGAHITDFNPAADAIDLTGVLARSGYRGADAVADGFVKITSDGAGEAQLWSNMHQAGNDAWWLVATLDGVPASSVHLHGAFITG